ncbi:MAG: DUF402 domain-containing protein [Candidatus Bipolaricaulia bacterium]
MYAIRIRGIYATALTHLFRRHGFEIVQPSEPICERFKLAPNQEPYDLDLYDLEDLQGVFVSGVRDGLERLLAILQEELLDAIVRRFELGLFSIHRGVVHSSGPEGSLIDLGGINGFLPEEELHPGEVVTVQVFELPGRGREPLLRRMIGLPGRYAVLISTGRIAISKKIEDYDERMRLSWLGAELAPKGWGIVWHTAAEGRSRAVLAKDIERLAGLAARLNDKMREAPSAPALLLEGEPAAQIEFPGWAKRRLDQLRSEVLPTISGHHQIKASGRKEEIDLLEQMVKKFSRSREKGLISASSPLESLKVGASLAIEHVKLDGTIQLLGQGRQGRVTRLSPAEGLIELEREIRTPGTYDGLGVAKEPGDRAVTEFVAGRWWYKTCYLSAGGELKGEYFNINTPIEIYPDKIRYVDLELDLVRLPGGEPRLIDEAELDKTLAKGWLSARLAERAREVAQALAEPRGGGPRLDLDQGV